MVAFGSDWPIVTISPFAALETAVNNTTALGSEWQGREKISLIEALTCYTLGAASALNAEDEIGRIAVGYRADFVILSGSPFEAVRRGETLAEIRAVLTVVGGRIAFSEL